MNFRSFFSLLIIALLISLQFIECKKPINTTNKTIVLYNKPLHTIQEYIIGSWKLIYYKGGICSTCKTYESQSEVWVFPNSNSIKQYTNGVLKIDTTLNWIKDLSVQSNGDSTYTLNYHDRQGYPTVLVVNSILNDTLILNDNSADAVFYHFTRN